MPFHVDEHRLRRCYTRVRELLLAEQSPEHVWLGELSTSALSTATAVMALWQVQQALRKQVSAVSEQPAASNQPPPLNAQLSTLSSLILGGLKWLITHQNPDGGWGDTVQSFSNISTTMLCHATLAAVGKESGLWHNDDRETSMDLILRAAQQYIDRAGGVPALVARYGKDRTFSVPILTQCALAGLVDWKQITPLPFELACLPAKFYKTVRLPVVSYALPALIAIGQVRHHFAPPWNPLTRVLRNRAIEPSLRVLERIQPSNGGFLEATPLTSFVTMSLAATGRVEHPVVRKGVEFIVNSVRPDGSWPIDTNLSTWVTTLAVNALGEDLPEESRVPLLNWLLDQQYQEVHPYTNADPGGWAWTPLPGGVPDADDTPGALLAVMELANSRASSIPSPVPGPAVATAGSVLLHPSNPDAEPATAEASQRALPEELSRRVDAAVQAGLNWLCGLQNRDGGFPTFCRGWGTLPFDRSAPDLTAHVIRAFRAHGGEWFLEQDDAFEVDMPLTVAVALERLGPAFKYLQQVQRPDGSWLPLWFGNQHAPDDINPTYGTAKVLAAYRDCGLIDQPAAQRGMAWLRANQNLDGGWGAGRGTPSSVEETALAVEALLDDPHAAAHVSRGLEWLMQRVEGVDAPPQRGDSCSLPPLGAGGERSTADSPATVLDPAPIGFYFAKLWYFERLYPLIFTVSCLRRAVKSLPEEGERRAGAGRD